MLLATSHFMNGLPIGSRNQASVLGVISSHPATSRMRVAMIGTLNIGGGSAADVIWRVMGGFMRWPLWIGLIQNAAPASRSVCEHGMRRMVSSNGPKSGRAPIVISHSLRIAVLGDTVRDDAGLLGAGARLKNMSPELSDTPPLGRSYCPGCEEADPLKEILIVNWCWSHASGCDVRGLDDGNLPDRAWITGGTQEAEAEVHRAFAAWQAEVRRERDHDRR